MSSFLVVKFGLECGLLVGAWLAVYHLSRGSAKEACRTTALLAAGMFTAELVAWVGHPSNWISTSSGN